MSRTSGFTLCTEGLSVVPLSAGTDKTKLLVVKPPAGVVGADFRRVCIAAYSQFVIQGRVTFSEVVTRSAVRSSTVRKIMESREFLLAVQARGVELTENPGLSEKQDLLLQVLGNAFDGLTMAQKLKRAGVSNTEYQAWLKQPLFAEQVTAMANQLSQRSDEAMIQLVRRTGEGDLSAIKLLFEVNGRYNPNDRQAINLLAILSRVMEVLFVHIQDPVVLAAVGSAMREIAADAGVSASSNAIRAIER